MARKVVVVAAMKKKEKGRKIGAKRHRKLILERCARVCVCACVSHATVGGGVVDYWLARVKSGSSIGDRDWFLAAVSRSGSNGK